MGEALQYMTVSGASFPFALASAKYDVAQAVSQAAPTKEEQLLDKVAAFGQTATRTAQILSMPYTNMETSQQIDASQSNVVSLTDAADRAFARTSASSLAATLPFKKAALVSAVQEINALSPEEKQKLLERAELTGESLAGASPVINDGAVTSLASYRKQAPASAPLGSALNFPALNLKAA